MSGLPQAGFYWRIVSRNLPKELPTMFQTSNMLDASGCSKETYKYNHTLQFDRKWGTPHGWVVFDCRFITTPEVARKLAKTLAFCGNWPWAGFLDLFNHVS